MYLFGQRNFIFIIEKNGEKVRILKSDVCANHVRLTILLAVELLPPYTPCMYVGSFTSLDDLCSCNNIIELLISLFQALLDATYVLECRLVNEDFPQDRSEKEITHLIGTSNGYFANLLIFFLCVFCQSIT